MANSVIFILTILDLSKVDIQWSPNHNILSAPKQSSNSIIKNEFESPNRFDLNLVTHYYVYTNGGEQATINTTIIIVDDEFMIRNAVRRVLLTQFKDIKENLNLTIIEASDGLECIAAVYIAHLKEIKITAIITDETMIYMTGSYSSHVIHDIIINGKFNTIPMFVSSALSSNVIKDKYAPMVKKIYSKPLDKTSVLDIIRQCGILLN